MRSKNEIKEKAFYPNTISYVSELVKLTLYMF